MEYALAFVASFAIGLWFIKGFIRSRNKREHERLQDYYESLSDNRKADDLLRNPDHLERMRKHFND